MDKQLTVVQGEASESDEEVNTSYRPVSFSSSSASSPQSKPAFFQTENRHTGFVGTAVVIEGEASEEEEVDTSHLSMGELPQLEVQPNLKLERRSSDLSDVPSLTSSHIAESHFSKTKYDTLLHRKLRESNWLLHNHLIEVAGQTYLGAARSLHGTTNQLLKSFSTIQDISHMMRLWTNDLFHLDDRIDIITTCKLLPDITIQAPV